MPLLSAAFIAQLLTASVGDRLETRAVRQTTDRRIEAENAAYASLGLEFDWLKLELTYSPSLLVSPLEETPRVSALTHTISAAADSNAKLYESARFLAAVHTGATYTQQNFRRQLLGAPSNAAVPSGAAPPEPTTPISALSPSEAVRVNGLTMRTAGAVGDVFLLERFSRRDSLTEYAGYTVSSGVDDDTRAYFPLAHGPRSGAAFIFGLSPRDTLTTRVDGQLTIVPSTDERAWLATVSQGGAHLFSRRASGDASIGVAYARSEDPDSEATGGMYPTANLGFNYNAMLAGGRLDLRFQLSYAPVLDRTSIVFDTRVNALGNATWTSGDWMIYSEATTAISTSPDEIGSLSTASGNAGANYAIGSGFAAEAGSRVAWQRYDGSETLPPTWVAFVALTWSYDFFETGQPR